MTKLHQRAVRGVGAVAVMLGFVAAGPTAAASAAPAAMEPRVLTLCSAGGYNSFLEFPDRGGLQLNVVSNGSCMRWDQLGGSANERVDVFGFNNRYIGSTVYNGSVGLNVVTLAGPTFAATTTH